MTDQDQNPTTQQEQPAPGDERKNASGQAGTQLAPALPVDPRGTPPAHVRVLKNGAWYDTNISRIVKAPLTGNIETQAQARALQTRRLELSREAAMAAIAEKGKAPGDLYGGWRTIVRAQVDLAVNVDKGRSSTEAARFVGAAAGFMSEAGRAHDAEMAPLGGIYIDRETVIGAIATIMASLAGDESVVIDG